VGAGAGHGGFVFDPSVYSPFARKGGGGGGVNRRKMMRRRREGGLHVVIDVYIYQCRGY
jgi:hypothetical protein